MRKILSLILTVVMIVSTVLTVSAFANPLDAYFVEFTSDDTTVTARVRLTNDSNNASDAKIIVGAYNADGDLLKVSASERVTVGANSEAYAKTNIEKVVDGVDAAYFQAFIWSADGKNIPVTTVAKSDAAPELRGIVVNGTEISGFNTDTTTYDYEIHFLDGVLPVVKGITANESIYATTKYTIAEDKKTAVAEITVKNLFTEASKTYTVNISLMEANLTEDEYNTVSIGTANIVDNNNVVKEYSSKEVVFDEESVSQVTHLVHGMTPSEYEAYVNEYLASIGGEPVDIEDVVLAEGATTVNKISTSVYTEATGKSTWQPTTFGVGELLLTTNTQRTIEAIHPDYKFLEDAVYLPPNANLNDRDNGGGWPHGALNGLKDTYSKLAAKAHSYDYTSAPSVPWFEFTVNDDCTVYVANYRKIIGYENDATWTKKTVATKDGISGVFEFQRDVNMNGIIDDDDTTGSAGPNIVYSKNFDAGDKVQLFNPACGEASGFSFCTFIVPRNSETIVYGKKTDAAVATAFDAKYTQGILYKDLRGKADLTIAETSGAQWVNDYGAASSKNVQRHELYYVNEDLEGSDYFAFVNSPRDYFAAEGNLLEFKVDKHSEVSILVTSQDTSAAFEGYSKTTGEYARGLYIQPDILYALEKTGVYARAQVTEQMVRDFNGSQGLTWNEIYAKYFEGKTEKTSEELLGIINGYVHSDGQVYNAFASADSKSVKTTVNDYLYNTAYSKVYKAGDTVVIPKDTGKTKGHARAIVVVVRPWVAKEITGHVTNFNHLVFNQKVSDYVAANGGVVTNASGEDISATDDTINHYNAGWKLDGSTLTPFDGVADPYANDAQRYYSGMDVLSGLENAPYVRQSMFILYGADNDNDTAFTEAAFYGTKKTHNDGNTYDFTNTEDALWATFVVNKDCDVVIASRDATPANFLTDEKYGWNAVVSDERVVELKRTNNTSQGNVEYTYYIKSFSAGDTVELYNANNGATVNTNSSPSYHVFVRVK